MKNNNQINIPEARNKMDQFKTEPFALRCSLSEMCHPDQLCHSERSEGSAAVSCVILNEVKDLLSMIEEQILRRSALQDDTGRKNIRMTRK